MSAGRTEESGGLLSLVLPLFASFAGHFGVIGVVLFFSYFAPNCNGRKPIIDPDDAMEVSMVVLPKSDTKLPDRAERAPVPSGLQTPPTPTPAPPTPTPPNPSDLVVKTQTPEPAPVLGSQLDDALDKLMMAQALQELDAAVGTTDRQATDPNSTSDEAFAGGIAGAQADPEYARYITALQALFMAAFRPLQNDPSLTCTMHVEVDEAGNITGSAVKRSSGIVAFDAAAERAVQEVGRVPLPPEKYLSLMSKGYDIRFKAQ